MLRSRLFWKLFLAFATVNLLATALLLRATLDWSADRAYDQAVHQLKAAAVMMQRAYGDRLATAPTDSLQAEIVRLGSESGYRLTLVGPDGAVLADSSQPDLTAVEQMENHAERAEIAQALREGQGIARRSSDSVDKEYVYLAQRHATPEGPPAVVRAAVPVEVIQQEVAYFRRRLSILGLAIGAALLAVTYGMVSSIVRPVLELNRVAEALGRGDYSRRAFVSNRDELGALAVSFNRMSAELESQIAQLRSSGQRQATVLGGMIEGVIAINAKQHVVLANKAAGNLLGFVPSRVEGRPLVEVIRNHNLHDALTEVHETGEPKRLDIEWRGAEPLQLSMQVTPLTGAEAGGAVIVLHDVTELRRLETIRQEFVANVSHELKTPLSSIKAYTETLLNGALHDEQHATKFLARIEEQADRLNALIQDMLSLARIESAQQSFDLTNVVVGEAAAACMADYAAQAESRGIRLLAEADEPRLEVVADTEGLRVILNNLIDNAIKYTPDNGAVTLSWRRADDGMARVSVADTGVGIPKEELPRVFERFHRVDKARSRELGGTGLGLSIVKHLTQAFGGTVAVESVVDQGSVFSITLPVA